MAKIEFNGIDEYAAKLADLGAKAEGVCKYACYEAAGMVADEIKNNTPEDQGDLRESLFLTPFENDEGFIYTEVKFGGYDRKGVPNQLKARVLEHGRSGGKIAKHPFIRQAVNRVKQAAQFSIDQKLNEKINEIMNS